MAGFFNAEIERIRDNLRCGHCEAVFKGSDSQARKVKYENRTVYCSAICRHASLKGKYLKPLPNRGPCLTCGKGFFSRKAKLFCTMECYLKSEQFAAMLAASRVKSMRPASRDKMVKALRRGKVVPCAECGAEIYQKASRPRKFCSTPCYRAYMANRFDKWIANPEGVALPQCYDEFLDREVLTCPIDGCSWSGQFLTLHANLAHGLPSQEFKRAVGFNLHSGIISKPLAQLLCERAPVGVAIEPTAPKSTLSRIRSYQSKESKEHRRKARAIAGPGPLRQCRGCGKPFVQTTRFGRALYCSPECRNNTYRTTGKQQVLTTRSYTA